jgi:hypothetical protein
VEILVTFLGAEKTYYYSGSLAGSCPSNSSKTIICICYMGVTFAPLQDLQVANKGFQPRYRIISLHPVLLGHARGFQSF